MTTMEPANPTMILKRNEEYPVGTWSYDYERRMRSLEAMKERYLLSMMMGCPPSPAAARVRSPTAMVPECAECAAAVREGRSPAFHWCVYDEVVTVGFRSPAGPIERPVKKHVEEEASA
ncbi:uncharacterized protein M6B38_155575 [Iris pallida]|uniref:Uncharacterized protein n=1 Tax=Iris pallida TaxID=29817 RepID=A0AAX6F4S4_IRIPA|nr:uncharacterized protein M6B38_155575 [Iris pallida]